VRKKQRLQEILTIEDAARLLGVAAAVLCRLDAFRRYKARRHAINGCYLNNQTDVLGPRRKCVRGETVRHVSP